MELSTDEQAPVPQQPLLDYEGREVTGVGRLDQVIGAEAAQGFFDERDERYRYLARRAMQRWSPRVTGYGSHRYR